MRRLRVLVADDNPVNRHLVAGLFERRGDTVVQVEDGARALAAATHGAFDIIFMDLEMPAMDGLAATRAIRDAERTSGRHVPIIALTSRAQPADREACLQAGMDVHLTKPADGDELFPLVAQLVGDDSAPAGAAPDGASSIDRAALLARMEGDRALLAEVVSIFQGEAPRMLAELRHALDAADAVALQRAAHNCKGAVAIFGAQGATESAQALEALGRSGSLIGAGEILTALEGQIDALSHDLGTLDGEVQE
jgi:two-component system sensor histidine kinase/response regulator